MKAKTRAVIKYKTEDFIVEEIGEKWKCKVSEKFEPNKKIDFGKFDLNSRRDFLWCEMEKFDIDHFRAIKELAHGIGKGINAIGYAGTKDKKAWTCQRISIFNPDIQRIKRFQHPNIFLKNFKWAKRKIKLGFLEANHFKITLRDIDKKEAMKVYKQIKNIKWFANFFGKQRFGSSRKNNVKIGKLILKRKFKEAVWAILTDIGESEQEGVKKARLKLKKEKNFGEACDYFPRFLRLEHSILEHLRKHPDDFIGALKKGNRKNILMFLHAVQSKIFNEVLKKAIEKNVDLTKKGQQNCILAGYKTRFSDGILGEIEREVLEDNGLELGDFDVKEIPYLRLKGSYRKALVRVDGLKAEIENDECFQNSKKIILEFTLPSGVYATIFLENFFDIEG